LEIQWNKFSIAWNYAPVLETILGIWGLSQGSPPTPSLESLDWRGVCKECLQNLERVEVRGQNLDDKRVAQSLERPPETPCAVAMICFFFISRKVRCHIDLWKLLGTGGMGGVF
jgi:hypothetical protein